MARLLEADADLSILAFCNADDALPKGFTKGTVYAELLRAAADLSIPQDRVVLRGYPNHRFPEHRQEILQELVDRSRKDPPDLVFAPSSSDVHQDHATVATEALRAFRKTSTIYGFDMPWNVAGRSRLDLYVELSEAHLALKTKALARFASQQGKANNCATPEYARALAAVRGNEIQVPFAEAFEVVRDVRRLGRGLFQ